MNSKEYWAQREEEQLKHYISDEKEYEKRIKQIYQDMLDNCNKEIASFYAKYASAEGITLTEAKKKVSKLDIAAYERKAEKYVKEKNFSAKANEEMRLYNAAMKINRLELLKANIGVELIAGHDELEKFMADILQGRTMEELERQAGILGKTVLSNAQKAHAIVNGSFQVSKVGSKSTFSDYIWQYQDLMREDLGRILARGLIQGKNPRALAKDLKKYWYGNDPLTGGGAVYCMERLMRTELARVQTEAQKQSFNRNGFEMYMFIVNGECCDKCREAADKDNGLGKGVYKVADMMPGDNAPPLHPNCRCSIAAHEDSTEYEAWLDHLANGGTTESFKSFKQNNKVSPSFPAKIKDVKSFTELDNYLKKTYNVSVEKSVKDLDFTTVKSALTGFEAIIDEFPELKDTLNTIRAKKSGVMSYGQGKLNFNPHYFADDKKLVEACKQYSESRWWTKNTTPAGIGAHECGHAVEELLINKNSMYEYDWQRVDVWNKCVEAKKIVSQACKNVKKTEYGKGKRNADLIGSISRYANENASETMAEAFADVFNNGKEANPLSLEIKKLTKEQLKTYERGENNA